MQRKFESKTRGQLFVEQIVWNAAAGAALAVMVLVLLCSMHWLDRISPQASSDPWIDGNRLEVVRPAVASDRNTIDTTHTRAGGIERPATEVAGVIGPSG